VPGELVNPYRAPAAGESVVEGPERPISMLRYAANVGCGSLVIGAGAILIVFLSLDGASGSGSLPWVLLCIALGMASVVPSMRWASRRRPSALRSRVRRAQT